MIFNIYNIVYALSSDILASKLCTFTSRNLVLSICPKCGSHVSNYYLMCTSGEISGFSLDPSIYPPPEVPDRQRQRQKRGDI